MAKDPKTSLPVSWNASPQRWIDGSVDNDLPMAKLSELFNVNHFIVSQVNPHIVPFLEKRGTRPYGPGNNAGKAESQESAYQGTPVSAVGGMVGLAVGEIMHRMHMLSELGIFPVLCTKVQVCHDFDLSNSVFVVYAVTAVQWGHYHCPRYFVYRLSSVDVKSHPRIPR
jgi:TAG lipase / steryl ester hydrolase / phospholipase A2 / LPA acyltransferase